MMLGKALWKTGSEAARATISAFAFATSSLKSKPTPRVVSGGAVHDDAGADR